jgi:oxygen-dependent protoporphyrinogen oxidase
MPTERTQVAIVGAGIAGLALGFRLARRGFSVRVLEAASRAGGNIRSEKRGGWLCEWGPNGFLDNAPATLKLVEDLGLGSRVARSSDLARVRWIVRGGKLRELPSGPVQFLSGDVLSPAGRARVLLEWAQPARREATDESVFDFARRRIGREAAEVLVDAMVTGVYAGDSRRLSLEAAFPSMRRMEQKHGGLFKAMLAMRREKSAAAKRGGAPSPSASGGPFGPGGTLTSFEDGIETLVQALAGALGSALQLESRIANLTPAGAGWRVELEHGAPVEAEQVVLACPSWAAAPLLRAHDTALADLLAAIPSAPVAVVCLGYAENDLRDVRRGFGFLIPGRERLPILGALFDTWVFPKRSPEGRVLWRAMLGGARDRGALDLSDEELVGRVLQTFEKLLRLRATPEMTYVVRHARGIPQYPVGHPQVLARLEERVQRHAGLHLAGNCYHGISMNACILEVETLSERIAASAPAGADTRSA